MGSGVVLNLQKAGHETTVFMRDNKQFEPELRKSGATTTTNLSEAISGQDFIFLCLPSMLAWQSVIEAVTAHASSGAIVVDLTTARPDLTAKTAANLIAIGIGFVDAPMLKGPPAARAGTIQLLVGGDADYISKVMPLLRAISEEQHLTGPSGTGHALKLINNAVTLTNSAIVYEAMALAATMGVDLPLAHTAMRESAAGSKRLDAIAPVLISGKHTPSFDVGTALKDLELYTDMARAEGATSFVGAGAKTIYNLGTLFGLNSAPVSQLGEMLYDLNTGSVQNIGLPGSIHNTITQTKKDALDADR